MVMRSHSSIRHHSLRQQAMLLTEMTIALAILALPLHGQGVLDNHDHGHDHMGMDFREAEAEPGPLH